MAWVDIPLATGAGEAASPYVSDAELVNLMLAPNPPGSPRPFSVVNTPPLKSGLVQNPALFFAQGMIAHGDYLWFILDGSGRYYDGASVTTLGGSVNTTDIYRLTGAGSNEIVIANGSASYRLRTTGITTITPPAGTFRDVCHLDGYTIYVREGTDEFYISALDDPTSINALDFSTADAVSDTLLACVADHRELVLLGRKHIEFWYNAGSADFPFVRASPGVAERGLAETGAVVKHNNAIYFLGDDLRVYRLEGYRPVPISTPWIEEHIPTDFEELYVRALAWRDNGRSFFGLSFFGTTGKKLIVYDIDAGLWHVRDHTVATSGRAFYVDVAQYRAAGSWIKTFAAVILGNLTYADVYHMDPDSYRDAIASGSSTDTTRVLTCPPIDGAGARLFESELIVEAEKVSANVTLKYSDDGGTTYTTHSTLSMNQDVVRFTRLGSFRRRIHRFEFSGNARIAINAIKANIERGAA